MGKPTGFLEYTRVSPSKTAATERVHHFNEFIQPFEPKELNKQAARCMNCGVPFCHSGCPLGNIIPEFNDAVYRESWQEAYEILSSTNNFPEFTGRLCPAPCEASCVLGIIDPPVSIELIEKQIVERGFEENWIIPKIPVKRTGKKIAIIFEGETPKNFKDLVKVLDPFERPKKIFNLLVFPRNNNKILRKKLINKIKIPIQTTWNSIDLIEEKNSM